MPRRRREAVGWTPSDSEIKGRMMALDALIVALGADIRRSKSPRINAPFIASFDAFQHRWFVFHGGMSEWTARFLSFSWEARFQDFLAAYERWYASYMERRLPDEVHASSPAPLKLKSLMDTLVPDSVKETAEHGRAMAYGVVFIAVLAGIAAWQR